VSNNDAPPLFAGRVDEAGLFLFEELSMPAALARHREHDVHGSAVVSARLLGSTVASRSLRR